MSVTFIMACCLLGMIAIMLLLYLLHLKQKDAGLVDLGWTAGVGLTAAVLALWGDGWWPRRLLVAVMVGAWSLRLFSHILKDRIVGKEEDGRYRALRAHWGENANRNFFWFFQAQTVLVIIFAIPLLVLVRVQQPFFGVWDIAGGLTWILAVMGEATADRQLARFRRNPSNRGRVCETGLWKFSRHPNYFFEWLHWCAYALMGIVHPWGWLTLLGPLMMWVFLWNLTGIPYTEKQALASRGEAYKKYQQTTSVFFPWFPKHST